MEKLDKLALDVQSLIDALSSGFETIDPMKHKLIQTLHRLDLPKPSEQKRYYSGNLTIESLYTTVKSVTFDDSKIKLYNNLGDDNG